jgi:hypothetical protein
MTHASSGSNDEDVGVVAFRGLTFAWSWGIWGPKVLLEYGLVEGVPVFPNLGAFGPTVAAFVLVAYANGFTTTRSSGSPSRSPCCPCS